MHNVLFLRTPQFPHCHHSLSFPQRKVSIVGHEAGNHPFLLGFCPYSGYNVGVFSFSSNDKMGAGWDLDKGVVCISLLGLSTDFPH